MMKQLIRSTLKMAGLELRKIQSEDNSKSDFGCGHMIDGLRRFKNLGLPVQTAIDVGAASGSWSLAARELWHDASYVMFEPLLERKSELDQLVKENPNFHFINKAAGKEKGEILFYIADDLDGSGIASGSDKSHSCRDVQVTSIGFEVQALNVSGPYLIKLDTHGFEIPILEGCKPILNNVSLFIIECYGFQIAEGSLLFWEMCRHMDNLGFRLFDIVDVMNRQKDGAFWQCDAFFINKENDLFKDSQYL